MPVAGTVNLDINNQPWRLLSTWDTAWSVGTCGQNVRIGIFDTGLVNTNTHTHFRNAKIKGRSNWAWRLNRDSRLDTNPAALDSHGHGTFVTGLIAASPDPSADPLTLTCPVAGLAPRAELHIFRVFTDNQFSMTSWFLDAFNYAIVKRLHIINLSNGGPDFMDQPYVDKVNELVANGILLVSAIGNDGPVFGTLNNPADQINVLGVGGVDANGDIATFSSRGVTAVELQEGYGRFKPDVVSWATGIVSSNLDGGCKALSGTSAASPIVTGSIALLISAVLSDETLNRPPINPASLKQAITAGATPLVDSAGRKKFTIFEQGAGLINLNNSLRVMRQLKPQASLWPSYLDFTECPYFWPYCSQPLYASSLPVIVNITIINSMGVYGRVVDRPVFHPCLNKQYGVVLLDIGVTFSPDVWPWTGHFALHISVINTPAASTFNGTVEGWISLKVESFVHATRTTLSTEMKLPLRVSIIPTPKREMRILWDSFHNIRYPAAYVPADNLTRISAPLDCLGDHIHTNFRDLYQYLRGAGYFVEVLQLPLTCFNASDYGTLMIVDAEEEFWPEEVIKLQTDVQHKGLSLLVFAGWFNTSIQEALKFYYPNNRRLWTPITGGANVPALNSLLKPFGFQFGDRIFGDGFQVGDLHVSYPSGSHLIAMPTAGGDAQVLTRRLVDLGTQVIGRSLNLVESKSTSFDHKLKVLFSGLRLIPTDMDPLVPVLGLWQSDPRLNTSGRVAVLGDSNCLDSSAGLKNNCFWLVQSLLQFANGGRIAEPLATSLIPASTVFTSKPTELPKPMKDSEFEKFSRVLLRGGSDQRPPMYLSLPPCKAAPPRALIAPVVVDTEFVVGAQPLLLNPPPPPLLPVKSEDRIATNASSVFRCHHLPDIESVDRYLAGGPRLLSITLLREYIGFLLLAGGLVLILLNFRTLLEVCTFRYITHRLRTLHRFVCGRMVENRQRSALESANRNDVDDEYPFVGSSRSRSTVVVETVHTSLTYRLVKQCLRQQTN